MQLRIGSTIFGNWVIKAVLGKGSYGTVYEIERNEFGRISRAAAKVIHVERPDMNNSDLLLEGVDADDMASYYQEIVETMMDECALMEQMKGDSHIVSYEDHQIEQDKNGDWIIYIRMELLTPLPLFLKNRTLSQQDIVQMGIDLCQGLETCQKNHVIHRDIKPDNIYVTDIGTYKLGDFGISKALEDTEFAMSQKGTRSYMAPEVYRGEPYDSTTDMYCLGLVLYRYMNENKLPFFPLTSGLKASERDAAIARRMSGEIIPPPIHASRVFSDIICKACSFSPSDRYNSPVEMRVALEGIVDDVSATIPNNEVSEKINLSEHIDEDLSEGTFNPNAVLNFDPNELDEKGLGEKTMNVFDFAKKQAKEASVDNKSFEDSIQNDSRVALNDEKQNEDNRIDYEIADRRMRQEEAQEKKERILREKQQEELNKEKEMERIRKAVKDNKDPFAPVREEERDYQKYDANKERNIIRPGETKWDKKSNSTSIKIGLIVVAVICIIAVIQIVRHQQIQSYDKERNEQYALYIEEAKAGFESEDYDEAIAGSQKAIAVIDGGDIEPYDILIKSYLKQGKYEQAAETIRDAKESNEKEINVHDVNEAAMDFGAQEQLIIDTVWSDVVQRVQNGDMETGRNYCEMLCQKFPDNKNAIEKKQVLEYAASIKDLVMTQDYENAQGNLNKIIELGYDDIASCFSYVAAASYAPVIGEICSFIDSGDYVTAYDKLVSLWTSYPNGLYYQDGVVVPGVVEGRGFFTDGASYMYYGDMLQSTANGVGCEMGSYGEGFYRVNGTFAEGFANGSCEAYYSMYQEANGKNYAKTVSGNYTGGYEDGEMEVTLQGKKKTYNFSYTASAGAYSTIEEKDGKYIYAKGKKFDLFKMSEDEMTNNGVPKRAPR